MQQKNTEQIDACFQKPPYHQAILDYLGEFESELWNWFASQRMSPKAAEDVRFDLLKSTYRVNREDQAELYGIAEEVARALEINAPITIYQAQNPQGLNAAIAFLPGEVHLVFEGPLTRHLTGSELRAILAHEFAHFALLERWNGELKVAFDCLNALANDAHAQPAHFSTLRLYQLYAEVFCDRVALAVTGDLTGVVGALVKVETGVNEINAEAFLRQADEIFTRESAMAQGVTHPETYIRARALRLCSDQHPQSESLIAQMIEGKPTLDELDLIARRRLSEFTRRVLDELLQHRWFHADSVLAHAKLFFHDYEFPLEVKELIVPEMISDADPSVRDYFCFVLLDFVAIDRDLEDLPIAAALQVAERLHAKPRLIELLRQEFKLRKMVIDKIDDDKARRLAEALV